MDRLILAQFPTDWENASRLMASSDRPRRLFSGLLGAGAKHAGATKRPTLVATTAIGLGAWAGDAAGISKVLAVSVAATVRTVAEQSVVA